MQVSVKWVWLSIVAGLLALLASLLGLFHPLTYAQETANWALQGRGQDIGNLLAVPVLWGSAYLMSRQSVRAFLVWTGTQFYLIYAYLIYGFFIHFNYLFLVYVAILGLSVYTLLGVFIEVQAEKVAKQLRKVERVRPASVVLMVAGSLFGLLWLSQVLPALLTGGKPEGLSETGLWVNPIHVIDLAWVLPAMLLTGILLWHRKVWGYVMAVPWLTFIVLMGSSILATFGLELSQGNSEVGPPMAMVGMLVLASLVVMTVFLRGVVEQKRWWRFGK